MAEVFISYSRKDKEFARRLHDALAARQRDTWVDWQNIPPTAEWLAEIYAGIEAADTFVFVLSPDSILSEVCALELAHAVTCRKRLVPVVWREVVAAEVSPALAAHNWIFFRDATEFTTGFERLLTAIDTDLAQVKTHTRLLTRAIEWDGRRRDGSLLLRGNDLVEAERWLALASAMHKTPPTDLQVMYILASRDAAVRAQRGQLSVVSLGLVLAAALSVFALVMYGRANNEALVARQAEKQADLAKTQATDLKNATKHLLYIANMNYAQQAWDNDGIGNVLQCLRATCANPERNFEWGYLDRLCHLDLLTLRAHLDRVTSVAYSPDGSRIVTGSGDRTAIVWDARSGAVRLTLKGHTAGINAVAVSPDSRWIVTGSSDKTAIVWDARSGAVRLTLKGHTAGINAVSVSPDGRWLVTGSSDKTAIIWDLQTGHPRLTLKGHTDVVTAVAFFPDSSRIVTGSDDRTARLWNAQSGAPLLTPLNGHKGAVLTVACSPDGRWIVTGSKDDFAIVWDAATGRRNGTCAAIRASLPPRLFLRMGAGSSPAVRIRRLESGVHREQIDR